ncbi:AraC family transcriptional regulator [Lentzea guizhouensis]|uniref:AraC family transcriptional regulator n=1 Tax=Lentzea guizhouensis TaxID=1586287 RepID=A0A1B2HRC3_9PSEU|nr:AraC family transcriptional regulator [Lentzea guizhouensis]ANZ40279.1 AraC family transcriptional regulator [Lentzea guizhouensis]
MDIVSGLLADVRARGAVFRQAVLHPPWALRMAGGAPLTLATMLRGHAWIVPDDGSPVLLEPGFVALVREHHTVADDPASAPTRVVTAADYCPAGPAAHTCGTPEAGATVLLSGAFERRGSLSERLLQSLPPVLVVPAVTSLAEVLAEEVAGQREGHQLVLDRLLDLMLVSALRAWLADPAADVPAWCRALDEPVVGDALRLLHADPAHPWTVASLAAELGVSRAAFARRFTASVGEPPMAYLARWRVAVAVDLLRSGGDTVGAIARKVGYSTAFALSAAFKRLLGARPSDYRGQVNGPLRPT